MRNRIWSAIVALLATHAAATALAQDSVHWQTDLEAAKRLAAETNRLVVVHFWAPWCKPCMALEQSVFSQPGVGPALEAQFVPVKLNVDEHKPLAQQLGVRTIPTDVVMTPAGVVVGATPSPQSPQHYLGVLAGMATNSAASMAGPSVAGQTPPPHDAAAMVGTDHAARQGYEGRPPMPTSQSAASGDRYAEYYQNRGAEQSPASAPAADPYAAYQAQPQQQPAPPQVPVNQPAPPTMAAQAPPQQAPWTAAAGQPGQPAMQPQQQPQQPPVAQTALAIPPGSPPVGLEGFCPVQLFEQHRWVVGDVRWGAIHEGRTYLFAGPEEQRAFLMNPQRYAPVHGGHDPVLAIENGHTVSGSREHGVFYEGRVYLFSSEESLTRFSQAPTRYSAPIMQAMRQQ